MTPDDTRNENQTEDQQAVGTQTASNSEPAAADSPQPAKPANGEPAAETPADTPTESASEPQPAPPVSDEAAAVTAPTAESPSAPPPTPSDVSPTPPAEPPRLRPHVGVPSGGAKAVPSLGDSPMAMPAEKEQAAEPEPRKQDPSAEVVPSRAPVDVPKPDDLDADLAAEIERQMATASQNVPAASIVPPTENPAETAERATATEEEAAPTTEEELTQGQRLQAKVQSVSGDDVFVDVGFRSPGVISLRQFDPNKPPEPGQQIEVAVERFDAAEGLIHVNLPRGRRKVGGNWDAVSVGQIVDCMVTKTNKGGLEVTVSSLRGFLPASQVDMQFVSDLEPFVGQKLTVKVMEVNPAKRNLIVSRREYIKVEREEQEKDLWGKLSLGQTFTGTVKTIKDYGAFVDIGGADGFLHIGEISWTRIRHPSDVLQEGQQAEVQVISLDPDRKRIGLGMKQLRRNPWEKATETYPVGSTVSGRVTRTTDFGAFVELEPGVEGLVHVSELDYRRVNKVTDVLKEGQQTELKVLDVDPDKKRISLSLKALKEKPLELERPEKKSDEDMAPSAGAPEPYRRQRKGPLKGGTGAPEKPGGGLFGNPNDFQ